MQNMYAGIANSPGAVLNTDVGAAATIIPVSDVSAFPAAPSRATIGTDENAETILYAAKTADALSGCTRGVEGVAQDWVAGTPIARNFTNGDYAALTGNITELAEDMDAHTAATSNPHGVTKAQVGLGNVDNTSDANKPVSTAAAAALATKAPLNLSAGFTPAAALAKPVAGDTVETALGKLSNNAIRLPNIGATDTWVKLFDSGVPTAVPTFNFMLFDGIVDPIQYNVSCYTRREAVGIASLLQVEKLTQSFSADSNSTKFGYVFDSATNALQVYVKRARYGMVTIFPLTTNAYPLPSAFESTITEPAGIVYVEPTTYAPEKLSADFTPATTLSSLAAGDSVETALEKLAAYKPQHLITTDSVFGWVKILSAQIPSTTVATSSLSSKRLLVSAGNYGSISHKGLYVVDAINAVNPATRLRVTALSTASPFQGVGVSFGYTTEGTDFNVYVKVPPWGTINSMELEILLHNRVPLPMETSEFTTTEPTGIVYVEPITYAPTASPAFTGVPTVPTAAAGTNTTQAASTEFVNTAMAGKAPTDSPAFTGTPTAPTAPTGNRYSGQVTNVRYVERGFYEINKDAALLEEKVTWLNDCVMQLAQQAGITLPAFESQLVFLPF